MPAAGGLMLAVLIEIPPEDAPMIRTYEDAVLPLLPRHGGRLRSRLSAVDGSVELHIISFDSPEGREQFAADPSRLQLQRLLQGRLLRQRVIEVREVSLR